MPRKFIVTEEVFELKWRETEKAVGESSSYTYSVPVVFLDISVWPLCLAGENMLRKMSFCSSLQWLF